MRIIAWVRRNPGLQDYTVNQQPMFVGGKNIEFMVLQVPDDAVMWDAKV